MTLTVSLAIVLFANLASVPTEAPDSLPGCGARGGHAWLSSRPSPLDSTEISIAGRTAKVCYSRPSARGRSVYDSLAPFGKVWRTGANEPTLLFVTSPLEVAGVRLEAGRYLLLTVPGAERWTVLFNRAAGNDPAAMFQSMEEYGRGNAIAEPLPTPIEQFTIRSEVRDGEVELLLEWGLLRARVPVRVPR
jgi:hypothetical protein